MSPPGPPNPHGDRPRMAEALASLKEGLRDTADPLYDSWKLRSRAATVGSDARPPEEAPRVHQPASRPVTEIAIDITLEGTPDQTPAVASTPPPASGIEVTLDDDFLTEEVFFNGAGTVELTEPTPDPERRPSVQADTVRVRVIRYQPFPRWALIVAAALLVFAASLLALRTNLPEEVARSTRSVLTHETAPPTAVVATPPPVTVGSPTVPALPALANSNVAPSLAAGAAEGVIAAPPALRQPGAESEFDDRPTPDRATAPVPPSSPAGKIPVASPRRRRGNGEFFRDPGF